MLMVSVASIASPAQTVELGYARTYQYWGTVGNDEQKRSHAQIGPLDVTVASPLVPVLNASRTFCSGSEYQSSRPTVGAVAPQPAAPQLRHVMRAVSDVVPAVQTCGMSSRI